MCQCHLEFERTKRPSSFCLGYFFSTKNFNHIIKVTCILNQGIVVGLTTSWLPPLHDISPIFTIDLLKGADFWYGKIRPTYYKRLIFYMDRFWHLVWANLTSCKFSLLCFFILLYIFLIYDVFINKVLQGCTINSFHKIKRSIKPSCF